jgi:hypothetical protein
VRKDYVIAQVGKGEARQLERPEFVTKEGGTGPAFGTLLVTRGGGGERAARDQEVETVVQRKLNQALQGGLEEPRAVAVQPMCACVCVKNRAETGPTERHGAGDRRQMTGLMLYVP